MKEPKVTAGGSSEPLEIRIKVVRNGVIVCTYRNDEPTGNEYVYKDVNGAMKDLEGIMSVLKEESPKETMSDLDREEEKINKGEY